MEGEGRKEAGGWPERRVEDDANGIDCWRRCNGTGAGIGPWRASNTSGRRGGKKRNERDLKELRRDTQLRERKRTSQAAGGTLISGYVTLSPSLPLSRLFSSISAIRPHLRSSQFLVQHVHSTELSSSTALGDGTGQRCKLGAVGVAEQDGSRGGRGGT